jgi:hypothetical protein
LLLYALSAHAGEEQLADEHLGMGLIMLETGTPDERRIATWLRGEASPPISSVSDISQGLGVSIVLAALAMRDDARREELLDASLRYDFADPFLECVLPQLLEG